MALDFCTVIYGLRLMTESLYTLLMMLAVAAGVCLLEEERLDHGAAFRFGLFMALAVYLRVIGWYLFYAGSLGMLGLLAWRRAPWRRLVTVALCAALPWVVLTGAWRLRTYRLTGEARFSYALSSHSSVGVSVLVYGRGLTVAEARRRFGALGPHPSLPCGNLSPTAAALRAAAVTLQGFYRHCAEQARALRRQEPWTVVRATALAAFSLMAFPHETTALQDYFAAPVLVGGPLGDLRRLRFRSYLDKWFGANLYRWFAFLGTFAHLWFSYLGIGVVLWRLARGRREHRALHALLLGVLLYHVLASSTRGVSAVLGVPRYRAPVMPILATYVGALLGRRHEAPS